MVRFIVEFLGPTGVGKTTVLKSILDNSENTRWQSLSECIKRQNTRVTPPEFNETEKLLLEMRLAHQLSAGLLPHDFLYNLYIEYQHMAFEVQNRQQASDALYVACEHIFQLFLKEMNFLILHKPGNVRALLDKRAFVFMTRSKEAIVKNVKQRREQGEYRSFANGATDAHLLHSINWFVNQVPTLKRFIRSIGNPFIEVSLDDLDAQKQIEDFLATLPKQ